MKIFRLFTIAAAALMMSACSSEDTTQNNNPVAGHQMHFSATIAAPNSGAGTRTEYTEDTENKKITVAWKVGDEIALVHDKVMDVVKVKTVNADGSATIDGTITSATDEATVQLVYPAARVSAVNSDGNPDFNEAVSGKLLTQDGTLTYIQNNIDFREGEGQLSVNGTEVTLNAAVDMVSSIAIWKLTLQNDAETPAALSATLVSVIKDGETPVTIAGTSTLSTATSTVYLAMDAITNETLTIEATVGEGTYSYTNEGISLALGKYYQSTVTMTKAGWAANEYNEASLDGTKVVFTKKTVDTDITEIPNGYTGTITTSGWYTVTGDNVVITANPTRINGDVHLILCDGAKLTINGTFSSFGNKLYIYGQGKGNGKLNVTQSDGAAINGFELKIHGGEITATETQTNPSTYANAIEITGGSIILYDGKLTATSASAEGIDANDINVYGGNLTATSAGRDGITFTGSFDVYGGEVEATSNAESSYLDGITGSGQLIVYGGKVKATGCNNGGFGFGNRIQLKSGTEGIKFYFSEDGTNWSDGYYHGEASTSDEWKRYAKAE